MNMKKLLFLNLFLLTAASLPASGLQLETSGPERPLVVPEDGNKLLKISVSGDLNGVTLRAEAREYGAKTIGITGYPHTPLKRSSDICLELYSPEQLFVSPRVAQFSLIDSLYVSIAIRQKDRVVQNIHRMNEVLEPFRMD